MAYMRLPKQKDIKKCRYSEQQINKMFQDVDPIIKRFVARIPKEYRDEVLQDLRIRLWDDIIRLFDDTAQTIEDFIKKLLPFESDWAFKSVLEENKRHSERFSHLEDWSDVQSNKPYTSIFYELDHKTLNIEDYRSILKPNEFLILQYLVETGTIDDCFQSLARQLGYHAKCAIPYILNNIYSKIREHSPHLVDRLYDH